MNATLQAISAYGKGNAPLRTDRGIEFEVFARITRAMTSASDSGIGGFPSLASALHSNRRLWTTLAADVSSSENGLPNEIRAQIFYLSEFVDDQTRRVLKGDASIQALRDVNLAIMRGLNGEGEQA